jgi:hypothetical protein
MDGVKKLRRLRQVLHACYLEYQGRFKSFPIEQDEHLLQVFCYVKANAVCAGYRGAGVGLAMVQRACAAALKQAVKISGLAGGSTRQLDGTDKSVDSRERTGRPALEPRLSRTAVWNSKLDNANGGAACAEINDPCGWPT